MIAPSTAIINRLITEAGLGGIRELTPLTGGKNNRVFRAVTDDGPAVLKSYFRHPADTRDRLGTEWAFSRFAWDMGIRCIPRPLGYDADNGLGLFAFVEGRAPILDDLNPQLMREALDFIVDVNRFRWKPLASKLPAASEACWSIAAHLATVERRVDRLIEIEDLEARTFVSRELKPLWIRLQRSVQKQACDNGLSLSKVLEPTDRCLSPSDFGFHNAILNQEARPYFIDFEYAGWDDPAKLICDFFCQPAVPVPIVYFEPFSREIASCFPNPAVVIRRARLLMPVYRVKWVCIRLNEFIASDAERRAFARYDRMQDSRQSAQLEAARAALAAIHDLEEVAT